VSDQQKIFAAKELIRASGRALAGDLFSSDVAGESIAVSISLARALRQQKIPNRLWQ